MKSPGAGLGDEFEMLAPAHARLAAHHVDHAFERAVMMRAGLGVGVDVDGAGPDLLRADAGGIDGGLAVHARRLRRVGIERVARDDAHAVVLPFRRGRVIVARRPCCISRGKLALLPAFGGTGKPTRFLGGAKQRLRLVDAFLLLGSPDCCRRRCRRRPAHTSCRPSPARCAARCRCPSRRRRRNSRRSRHRARAFPFPVRR